MQRLLLTLMLIAAASVAPASESRSCEADAVQSELQSDSTTLHEGQAWNESNPVREALQADQQTHMDAWMDAVIERLVERNRANDLAIASLLAQIGSFRELTECEPEKECTVPPGGKESKLALHKLLAESALERADELDVILLESLAASRIRRLPAEQQDALANRLLEIAPQRLSSWNTKIDLLHRRSADPALITDLIEQANRSVSDYRDPFYVVTRHVDAALALVAVPAELQASWLALDRFDDCTMGCIDDDDGSTLRLVHALGFGMATAIPAYQSLFAVCDPVDAHSVSRSRGCLRLARSLAQEGENILEVMVGTRIWHRLVEGSTQEADALAAKRRFYWQWEIGTQMQAEAFGDVDNPKADPEAIRLFSAAIREEGSSELSVIRDYMREAGIALTPHPAWMPMQPDVLKARR